MSSFNSVKRFKYRSGFNKQSEKQRNACVLSTYKYLLDTGVIKDDGPAANRYNELLYRRNSQ